MLHVSSLGQCVGYAAHENTAVQSFLISFSVHLLWRKESASQISQRTILRSSNVPLQYLLYLACAKYLLLSCLLTDVKTKRAAVDLS